MSTQVSDYSSSPLTTQFVDQDIRGSATRAAQELLGTSNWVRNARNLVRTHGAHDETLILEGEPGSGKKFLARLIHRSSRFQSGAFVSLGLGQASGHLSNEVLSGLLSRGESDAEALGLAEGGTLYLEYQNPTTPPALPEVIQRANRRRAGRARFRVLIGRSTRPDTASWRPGRDGFEGETFRIPPLRARADDIEALVIHFIDEYSRQTAREPRAITPEAMNALRSYDWPRNVSELKTLVFRLASQSKPPSIDSSLLPAYLSTRVEEGSLLPAGGVDLAGEVERLEVSLIRTALAQSRGRQNAAARLLRIKPTTLFMKLKRYGIEVENFKADGPADASPRVETHRGLKEAD